MTARILVVDDEPGIRDMLRWELTGHGYAVAEAADGREAVSALRRHSYDVVISDVRMPGLGGLDVLREVRDRQPDTEVIISTGFASLETAVECVRAGAFDFLQKPCQVDELVSSVERALERRQLRSLKSLYQACQVIFAAPTDPRLPEAIVGVAMRVMPADHASLLLLNPSGALYAAHSSGAPGPEATLAMDGETARQALRERAPVLWGGEEREGGSGSDSCIAYPLLAGPREVGALTLRRTDAGRRFRAEDLDRASVLASQVLLALQNGYLTAQMVVSERLATIGQLAAGVAHEINNPVAYVQSSLAFLTEGLQELQGLTDALGRPDGGAAARAEWEALGGARWLKDLRDSVRDATEGASRVREIASDLRALSRSDAKAEPEPLDLNDVIRSAIRISRAEVRGRAAVVEALGPGAEVMGLPGRLSQVFVNLLVNAAQAMAEWDGPREISVTTAREGDSVVARVADTGPGIPPEHLPRLFEAFFTTKKAGVGTGLGLSICREIVRAHQGEIRAGSEPGRGAIFTVTLPAA